MIKRKPTVLKSRHDTIELCKAHLDEITKVNKSKILDFGVGEDEKGYYSWVQIKEWVNEDCND